MTQKAVKRTFLLLVFLGSPIVGWTLRADRGLLFGLAVSVLAAVWFALEEKKVV